MKGLLILQILSVILEVHLEVIPILEDLTILEDLIILEHLIILVTTPIILTAIEDKISEGEQEVSINLVIISHSLVLIIVLAS